MNPYVGWALGLCLGAAVVLLVVGLVLAILDGRPR